MFVLMIKIILRTLRNNLGSHYFHRILTLLSEDAGTPTQLGFLVSTAILLINMYLIVSEILVTCNQ
jgi:hypothetical protein